MTKEHRQLQTIYSALQDKKELPLPRIIHVETRSKCNSKCDFCPASIKTDQRADLYMPDEMIAKIIRELAEVDYSGRLSFYNNNEPFMDERIFALVRSARQALPKAYLELKSNGLLLTFDKVINIFNSGLDTLYINDYTSAGRHHKNIQEIIDRLDKIRRFKGHFEAGQYYSRILISIGDIKAIKGTRAGESPNKQYQGQALQRPCFRPCEMVTINPKGEVSVCSEDFYCKLKMGNVKDSRIIDLWTSNCWEELRRTLTNGDRNCTDACSKCDYLGYNLELLKENNLFNKKRQSIITKGFACLNRYINKLFK